MRDTQYPLQKAYLNALTGITYNSLIIPVYYQMIPDNMSPDNYIIFGPVTNTDRSNFIVPETDTLMRVTIHTFQMKYNTGVAISALTEEVFNRIYPSSQFNVDLSTDNLQGFSTSLFSDLTQDYGVQKARIYIDRILIFRHKIVHMAA